MNKDDLPDISFSGIPADCLHGVRKEMQEIVAKAFPDLRVLWNPKIDRYQCAVQMPGAITGWVDAQKLVGWFLMGRHFPPTVTSDEIVTELRRIQDFNANQIKAMGFEDAGEYVDDLWEKQQAEAQARQDALADDIFDLGARDVIRSIGGMTPGESGNMFRQMEKTAEREADIASGRTHLRRGKVRARTGLVLNLNNLRT